MGNSWDGSKTAFDVSMWAEVLRVLRPGGHLVAFGGTRTWHRLVCAIEDAGFEVRDCLMWLYGTGFPKSLNLEGAQEGWGTALKPAWEPIVLARKPLAGTVASNVQAHEAGALNVDACRIEGAPRTTHADGNRQGTAPQPKAWGQATAHCTPAAAGRWPANVVLDEEAAAALDAQSGVLRNGGQNATSGARADSDVYGSLARRPATRHAGDSGGASRFFYVAKASRRERGEGNTHPTVKPLSLMRWLVRLVTPPGGLVLDPFAGSGTTLLAARAEGFPSLGVEKDKAYCAIIRRRLAEGPDAEVPRG